MAYHVSVETFDGPLDLLLQLVSRSQVDIRDIFISQITDQFLAYVHEAKQMDMDRESEFIQLAAQLMEIKSRRLLPHPELDEGLAEQEEDILRRLEEYRLFKLVSAALDQRGRDGGDVYFRLPEEIMEGEIEVENASVELLSAALVDLLARVAIEPEEAAEKGDNIVREGYTVSEQMLRIERRLLRRGTMSFEQCMSERPVREEVITTFLALLELVRRGFLLVEQEALFGGIVLKALRRRGGNDGA